MLKILTHKENSGMANTAWDTVSLKSNSHRASDMHGVLGTSILLYVTIPGPERKAEPPQTALHIDFRRPSLAW